MTQPPAPPPPPDNRSRTERVLRAFHDEQELGTVFDRRLLARLWPFVKPHSRALLLSVAMLLLVSALALARPLVMRHAFEVSSPEALTQSGFLLLVMLTFEQTLLFAQMYMMQIVGARTVHDLRRGIFGFLHGQSIAYFDRRPIGRLVTRVTNDTDAIGELFASGVINAIGDLIRLLGVVILMLALDWRMSLFAFALLPPIGVLLEFVRRGARKANREIRIKLARLNAFINEQVQGVSVVQSFCRERQAMDEFDEINHAYRNANFRAITLDATVDATVEMVSSICIASVLWYTGLRAMDHEVSFGTVVAFVAYIEQFFVPIRDLSSRYTLFQSAMAGAERVFQLLDTPDQDAPRQPGAAPRSDELAFEFDAVTFGYRPDAPVLHDVSIRGGRCEKVALVGATGSGKSTIASLLMRLYDPQQGTVRVGGRDVKTLERGQVRSNFAVVPQDVYLFRGTIASNVALGEPDPDRAQVEAVLRRVGADEFVDSRAGGLDAVVEERGANLSVGQRQLIAFARALYRDAPVLVLDEATASIDSNTEAKLNAGMAELMQGRAALIIAHRLSTIRAADRIIVLHRGRVVEQGRHEELVGRGGLYARLYRLQMARQSDVPKPDTLPPSA